MSPILMLVIMLSTVSLLVVLLFVVRKKNQEKEVQSDPGVKTVQKTPEGKPPQAVQASSAEVDLDFSGVDLSAFGEADASAVSESESGSLVHADVLQLVSSLKFFQGENLQKFESFLNAGNHDAIRTLIQQKFVAQGKENPEQLAGEVMAKLGL